MMRWLLLLIPLGLGAWYVARQYGLNVPALPYFDPGSAPLDPNTKSDAITNTSAANTISQSGIAFIQRQEGFRATPYRDAAGHMTIGYGHKIVAGDGLSAASTLTQDQAYQLLLRDLAPVISTINSTVIIPLNQSQYDALCSLIFNIGTGAFAGSTLLQLLNVGNIGGAVAQFGRWVFAGGVPNSVLQNRRAQEASLFTGMA